MYDVGVNELLIYMDVCCLNRPFDNQAQYRIRIESEAVLTILSFCQKGEWTLAASDPIEFELSKLNDIDKLKKIRELYSIAENRLIVTEQVRERSKELQVYGVKFLDSLHLALAEIHRQDVLLTTDDNFIAAAKRYKATIPVINPIVWLMEV